MEAESHILPPAGLASQPAAFGALKATWPLILFMFVSLMLRYAMLPMQQAMQDDLHLDDVRMSLVQGLAMSIPVAMLSMPFGRWADRTKRTRLLVLLMMVSIVSSILTAVASGFATLFVARMLAGMGSLCALPALFSLAGDLVPPARRGRAMMMLMLGGIVGSGASYGVGGWLFGYFAELGVISPWRQVNFVLAGAAAVLSLPVLLLKEPPRLELGEAADASLSSALRELWDRRRLCLPLLIGQTAMGMATMAGIFWTAAVLERGHGLQPQQFAGWMSIVTTVAGIVGAVFGGLMVDRAEALGRSGAVMGIGVLAAAVMAPAALYSVVPSIEVLAVLLAVYQIFGSTGELVTNAAIVLFLPNELRGLFTSLGNFVFAIFALALAPTLVAWINQALGGGAHIGLALLIVSVPLSLVAVVGFLSTVRGTRLRPERSGSAIQPLQGAI